MVARTIPIASVGLAQARPNNKYSCMHELLPDHQEMAGYASAMEMEKLYYDNELDHYYVHTLHG